MVQRQRRADWVRNELEQRPWRPAVLWTVGMGILLVAVVALTEHFGWGIRPIKA